MSIGNDIVDLSEETIERAADMNFYSKFITETELGLYQPGTMPFYQFVWLLWTIKESVYKYLSRNNEEMVFAPIRIPVTDIVVTEMIPLTATFIVSKGLTDHQVSAQVGWADSVVHTRSLITKNFIATFAARNG